MGLTIHYGLRSNVKTTDKAISLVKAMHGFAKELPFEKVGKVKYYGQEICERRETNKKIRDELWQTGEYLHLPWAQPERYCSISVDPVEVVKFDIIPGPGSEWATIGLAAYPKTTKVRYEPRDDKRFTKKVTKGCSTSWEFDWQKFSRWAAKQPPRESAYGTGFYGLERDFIEERDVPTRLSGWRLHAFCKTVYASDPECGGLPNFLRCHVGLIHLLERIGSELKVKVGVNDEGDYGDYSACDDWREADAEGRERVYTDHKGKHDVCDLIRQVTSDQQRLAAFAGAMKDAFGGSFDAPITKFKNFEQLEFKGSLNEDVQPFLKAMARLAKQRATSVVH